MSDYGFMASKNGQRIDSNGGFMDMEKAVGCTIEDMKGNWFAYLGNEDLFVAIYKTIICIVRKGEKIISFWHLDDNELPYTKYRKFIIVDGVKFDLKRLGDGQFLLRFKLNGDFYKCVYGHAVGEKTHIWWKRALGIKGKENKKPLKWAKYLQ